MLLVYDVAQHDARPLLGHEEKTLNAVFGRTMVRRIGNHTLLYVGGYYLQADQLLPGLFRIDDDSYHEDLMLKGGPDAREWLVDDHGEVVAERQYQDDKRRSVFLTRRDGELREVAADDDLFDRADIVGFGTDADSVVVSEDQVNKRLWKSLSLLELPRLRGQVDAFGLGIR